MNAEIISVSSNPFALAKGFDIERFRKELEVLSVQLKEQITVGGSPQELVEALASALRHSHVIIVIGAANPSLDYSRKTVCDAIGFSLSHDDQTSRQLQEAFQRRGEPFTEGAQAQADFPEGAVKWESVSGLTTGCALRSGNQCLVFLPGYGPDLSAMAAIDLFHFVADFSGAVYGCQELALDTQDILAAQERFNGLVSSEGACLSLYLLSKKVLVRSAAVGDTHSHAVEKAALLMQRASRRVGDIQNVMLQPGSAPKLCAQMKQYFSNTSGSAVPTASGFSIAAKEGAMSAHPLDPPADFAAEGKKEKKRQKGKEKKETVQPDGKKSSSGKFRKIMLVVCLVCFLVSSGYIVWYYYNSYANKKMSESLASMYGGAGSVPDDFPADYLPSFGVLYGINRDIKGWLEIEGTDVAYPVVQSTDNDYYLRRDFYQKGNDHGVPFLDYRSDSKEPSDNMVIYGHNMRDGQIFGELIKYKDLSYYQEHPVIRFDTVYAEGDWKVLAVFRANTLSEHGEVFSYQSFSNAANEEEFNLYVQSLLRRSLFNLPVDVQYGDKLLTLSTCTYEFSEARFVVVARKVREGESIEVDTASASVNSNPLMPDVWYELYGGYYESDGNYVDWSPSGVASGNETGLPDGNGDWPPPSDITSSSSSHSSSSSRPSSSSSISSSVSSSSSASSSSSNQSSVSSSGSSNSSSSSIVSSSSQSSQSSSQPSAPSSTESSESATWPPSGESNNNGQGGGTGQESSSESSGTWPPKEDPANGGSNANGNSGGNNSLISTGDSRTVTVYNARTGSNVTDTIFNIVAGMTQNEVGDNYGTSFYSEAIKAQAVACRTYLEYCLQSGTPTVYIKTPCQAVTSAVQSTSGKKMYYNGRLIQATYFAISCGNTNSSSDVWGGSLPYLQSVSSPYDKNVSGYKRTATFSQAEVISKIRSSTGINLDPEHPDEWFEVLTYTAGGYNGTVRINGLDGSTTKTGRYLRETVFGLRSACFTYEAVGSNIVFTTYGYGHGVGMSQMGANQYAMNGWNYTSILTHYYTGISIS